MPRGYHGHYTVTDGQGEYANEEGRVAAQYRRTNSLAYVPIWPSASGPALSAGSGISPTNMFFSDPAIHCRRRSVAVFTFAILLGVVHWRGVCGKLEKGKKVELERSNKSEPVVTADQEERTTEGHAPEGYRRFEMQRTSPRRSMRGMSPGAASPPTSPRDPPRPPKHESSRLLNFGTGSESWVCGAWRVCVSAPRRATLFAAIVMLGVIAMATARTARGPAAPDAGRLVS